MRRALLDEVLNRRPPGPLYHYTKSSGFMGIISQAEIWATHTQYLNDVREYLYAVDLIRQQIQAMRTVDDPRNRDLLEKMEKDLDSIESINVCVCSFSEDGDSLSQWRAYAGGPSGFSIGFEAGFLEQVAAREGWLLAPCIYDERLQGELVGALLEEVVEENCARAITPEEVDEEDTPPGGNLIAYLNRYAPILKDPSFKEEKEWRLISRPLRCSHELFDFRSGNSMLIPYYKLQLLDEDDGPLDLREVVVGPTPHPRQSIMSARSLLTRHSLWGIPVTESKVPYRNW